MHKLGLFMCCRKLYMLLSWSLFISFWDTLIASYSLYSLCVQILIYCQHILWFTMRMQYKWAELSVYALQRSIASLLKPSLRSYIHTILLHHISTKLENWFVFGAFYSDAKLISRRQKLRAKYRHIFSELVLTGAIIGARCTGHPGPLQMDGSHFVSFQDGRWRWGQHDGLMGALLHEETPVRVWKSRLRIHVESYPKLIPVDMNTDDLDLVESRGARDSISAIITCIVLQ